MLEWFGSLAETVFALGYPGIVLALIIEGLGLPFPGDAVMAFYGFAAAQGRFNLPGVIVFSLTGYLIGAVVSYAVSHKLGSRWMTGARRPSVLKPDTMDRTIHFLDKYGPWFLITGRFLPGVRTVSSYVAGLIRMDFGVFLLYTGIGSVFWCAFWVLIGYWFGENVKFVITHVQSSITYFTAAAFLAGGLWWLIRRRTAK